jgi:hypothetical protein
MTLVAAAIGGFGLWLVAHFDQTETGEYWAAMGVIAGAGLLFGLAQLRGRGGNPPAAFLIAFVPVLVAGGWVLLAMEPHANWFRDNIRAWDRDLGINDVVHYVGLQVGVVAFAIGLTFGLLFEPGYLRRRRTVVVDETAADLPTAAERRETAVVERERVTTTR